MKIYRSGPLYLVRRGESGRLVNPETGRAGLSADFQSILAHTQVIEPWDELTDRSGLPELVARVARAMADA